MNVCQTLVRNGCFDIPSTPPDQSLSETTTSHSDQTLTPQPFLHEYHPETDQLLVDKTSMDDQDTWLVVDLESNQSEEIVPTSETIVSVFISYLVSS